MTQQERERLLELAAEMRKIAAKVGPMHSFWDEIADIEEAVKGRSALIEMTPAERIASAEKKLSKAKNH